MTDLTLTDTLSRSLELSWSLLTRCWQDLGSASQDRDSIADAVALALIKHQRRQETRSNAKIMLC